MFPEALKLAWVREKLGLDQGRRTKRVKMKEDELGLVKGLCQG